MSSRQSGDPCRGGCAAEFHELKSDRASRSTTTAPRGEESPARARATYQDVLDAPVHQIAEVVDGKLYAHPRPAMPHARAGSSLGAKIGDPFDYDADDPGGWWIVFEPELHLGENILVPDFAGWRWEQMPEYPDGAYCTVAPDWVCEVLSPSARRLDLHGKRPVYACEAVGHLWLVDPTRPISRDVRSV